MDDAWKALAALVAVIAALIAYQQVLVARQRLKLDLFEKRFAVFAAVRRFLSLILQDARVNMEHFHQYRAAVAEADFLFEPDITSFLKEIDQRALKLWARHEGLKEVPVGDQRTKLVSESSEDLKWLIERLPLLRPTFSPCFAFTKCLGGHPKPASRGHLKAGQ
jgi:hypothetical protein